MGSHSPALNFRTVTGMGKVLAIEWAEALCYRFNMSRDGSDEEAFYEAWLDSVAPYIR